MRVISTIIILCSLFTVIVWYVCKKYCILNDEDEDKHENISTLYGSSTKEEDLNFDIHDENENENENENEEVIVEVESKVDKLLRKCINKKNNLRKRLERRKEQNTEKNLELVRCKDEVQSLLHDLNSTVS
ncbi:hypothetical protein AGMMS49579_03860 [Spirochaetia bacterium]|nr:hypothetical protein AGMMS49579_03860 [Spirochaetia bacterium]